MKSLLKRLPYPLCGTACALGLSLASLPARAAEDAKDDAADSSDEKGDDAKADDEKDGDAAEHEDKAKDDDAKTDDEKGAGAKGADSFGHMGQLGLRFGLVAGYRIVMRYETSPYCTRPELTAQKGPGDQQTFCGYASPLAGDLGLSFGLLDFLEPFAWARLGFSADDESDAEPLAILGAGVRLYTMSDAAFKIFIEPSVGLELEGGQGHVLWQLNGAEYKNDLVFHLSAGPELDVAKQFGVYVTGGVTAGVLRALTSSLDLTFGIQARVP